jgi:hypothetical protein
LSEFYAVSTRKLGVAPQITWAEVARYFAWEPQPVDEALLRAAREIETRHKLSWWDSMIVAAAQLQECTLLLTEDLQDGATFGAVTVRSPFTLDVREERAAYTVGRFVVPAKERHPRVLQSGAGTSFDRMQIRGQGPQPAYA